MQFYETLLLKKVCNKLHQPYMVAPYPVYYTMLHHTPGSLQAVNILMGDVSPHNPPKDNKYSTGYQYFFLTTILFQIAYSFHLNGFVSFQFQVELWNKYK